MRNNSVVNSENPYKKNLENDGLSWLASFDGIDAVAELGVRLWFDLALEVST